MHFFRIFTAHNLMLKGVQKVRYRTFWQKLPHLNCASGGCLIASSQPLARRLGVRYVWSCERSKRRARASGYNHTPLFRGFWDEKIRSQKPRNRGDREIRGHLLFTVMT